MRQNGAKMCQNGAQRCNSSLIRATRDANLNDQLRRNGPKCRNQKESYRGQKGQLVAQLSDARRQSERSLAPKCAEMSTFRSEMTAFRSEVAQLVAQMSDTRRQSERPLAPKWAEMPKSERVISRAERAIDRSDERHTTPI